MKRLLKNIGSALEKRHIAHRMGSGASEVRSSSDSKATFATDENSDSKPGGAQSNISDQMNINFSIACQTETLTDGSQQIQGWVAQNDSFASELPTTEANGIVKKIMEMNQVQLDDMKKYFENQTMEMRKEFKAHQEDTKSRLTKIEENDKETRNEASLQHREIRRRFDRMESKINKGYFN